MVGGQGRQRVGFRDSGRCGRLTPATAADATPRWRLGQMSGLADVLNKRDFYN